MDKYNCEIMKKGKCSGCTGLAEKDWVGKYDCKEYKKHVNKNITQIKEILGIQEKII